MVDFVPRSEATIQDSPARLRFAGVHLWRRWPHVRFLVGAGLLVLIGVSGLACGPGVRRGTPVTDPNTLGATGFLHYLSATPVVTVDEGARAVLALVEDEGADGDFDSRWARLCDRGGARRQWRVTPEMVLDRGTFAYMLCGVLGVPKGLNDHLSSSLGWGARRAATRTAVYEGLLDYGPSQEPIGGGVLISSLVRAEQWQERQHRPGSSGS